MTTTFLVDEAPAGASPPTARPGHAVLASALALGLGGLALAWAGAAWSVPGAALLLTAGWMARSARAGQVAAGRDDAGRPADDRAPAGPGADSGAAVMAARIIPVWARQTEATRQTVDAGLAQLLESFSAMSGPLEVLTGCLGGGTGPSSPGLVGPAVEASAPELAALQAPSRRAFEQRDAAVAELRRCGEALGELAALAREAREIGRHTRLVAFNASIEANRLGDADAGGQAVASEMRTLADRIGQIGDTMARTIAAASERVDAVRRDAEVRDTTDDELALEIDLRAREALGAMLASAGTALSGSIEVRDAGQALRNQLDEAFVNFQFGDRISQMLAIVGNDMTHFAQWIEQHPIPTAKEASEWLDRLEASYTMDEQRSKHHGNVHIDRGSEVEFF